MAVGLAADTDYVERTGIPSGGAGTLSLGGFKSFYTGVWLYRPSSGNSSTLTSGGYIIGLQAGAREMKFGFDNTFGDGSAGGPLLQIIFNSGGGANTPQTFAGANFLDEWVYYFLIDTDLGGGNSQQTAGYRRLSSINTPVTITRANDNAGSQYINTLNFGNSAAHTDICFGHYAYARARAGSHSIADTLTYANSAVTEAGDWGFWPLANNTDTGDTSGNSRAMTFGGTPTSQSSPSLSPPAAQIDTISGILRSALSHKNGIALSSVSRINGLLI